MGLSVQSAPVVVLVTRRNVAESAAVALERKAVALFFFYFRERMASELVFWEKKEN